ncbi:MAG: hypothetical protein AABY22_28605 [Nanoarchaeota archaeon]
MKKKTQWNKIFKLGDKINKDLKMTEEEAYNLIDKIRSKLKMNKNEK